ncbi:MAG: hypothetical protein V4714_01560 [Bacteroidota bacterium]
MKNNHINKVLAGVLLFSAIMVGCKDEVLVPVVDNKSADSLSALIAASNTSLITVNTETNTIKIANEQLQHLYQQYDKTRDSLSTATNMSPMVQYAVNVLSTANTVFSSGSRTEATQGVPNVSVRIEQNGVSQTAITGENGVAIFKGLKMGSANVFVTGSSVNHTDVEYAVYLGSIGTTVSNYTNGGDVINASSQIALFPTSGASTATIKGSALINMRADDDTLRRWYNDTYATASLKGKFLSVPGMWNFGNLGADATKGTIHSFSPTSTSISFDAAADRMVIAYPQFPTSTGGVYNNLFSSQLGRITSISYKGAITTAKVAADGTYMLMVPASARGLNIIVQFENNVITGHTRLTSSANNLGQSQAQVDTDLAATDFTTPSKSETGSGNEPGSTIVNYSAVDFFSGTNLVNSTTITKKKLRVISQQYKYTPYYTYADGSGSTSLTNYWLNVKAGVTSIQNIYLFPTTLQ